MDKFEAKTLLQKLDIVQGFLDKKIYLSCNES